MAKEKEWEMMNYGDIRESLGRLTDIAERNAQRLTTVCKLLQGNGKPERGIVVRLDRVEKYVQRNKWLERTMLVAVLGASMALAAGWIKGHL